MLSDNYKHLKIILRDTDTGEITEVLPANDLFDSDYELEQYAYVVNDGEELTVLFN